MNYFTFLSRSNPSELGYKVSAETDYSRCNGVCKWATMYQTYGDGSCQHSAEVPFAREMLPDFLGSLLCALGETEELNQV